MPIEIKNEEKFEVDEQEMERFRGIPISGYHILPHENHYWSAH